MKPRAMPKPKERVSGGFTTGQRKIQYRDLPSRGDDSLPPWYKDADDKRVLADWGQVFDGSPRLWTLVEVRDSEVVAGAAGTAGLAVVDVADPTKPLLLSVLKTPETKAVWVTADGRIFATDRDWGLLVVERESVQ